MRQGKLISVIFLSLFAISSAWAALPKNLFAEVETSYAYIQDVNFNPTNLITCSSANGCWDNPQQSFQSSTQSLGFGGDIGYRINPYFMTSVTYDTRNSFDWNQNFAGNPLGYPNPRKRFVNRASTQTAMLNFFLTSNLQWSIIDPYFGAGIGMARNHVGTVSSVDLVNGSTCIVSDNTSNNFAWQLVSGLNINADAHVFFDAGYRFIDTGKWQSGSRLIAPIVMPIPPLRDNHVYINEVYLGVGYRT